MNNERMRYRWLRRFILALFLVGTYAPVAMVFAFSFNQSRLGTVWTGFSTRWYGELFKRRELWESLATSLIVAAFASTLSTVLGTLAAWGLQWWRPRTRQLARGLFALPLVVPDMIIGVSLALFFNSLTVDRGLHTIILAHMVFGISYAFVVMSPAVELMDKTLYSAALDCGARPLQAHRWVTLPMLAPSIGAAWLLVFVLSFDDFLITFFSKGLGNDTLPIKIYSQMRFGLRPATNALFVVIFVITVMGLGLATWLSRRRPSPWTEGNTIA